MEGVTRLSLYNQAKDEWEPTPLMTNYMKIMYRMTQRHVDLSVISDSISLSDDSVTEVAVITRTIENSDNEETLSDRTPEVDSTPQASPLSPALSSSPDMFEEDDNPDDTELLPVHLEDRMYNYVKTFEPAELVEIGNLHGFFSSGKVSKDNMIQFKAFNQTISIYMNTSTVRLQPGGEKYDRVTIFECNAKEFAWLMIEVQVVQTGARLSLRRSKSATARSVSRSPIVTRRGSIPRRSRRETFSPSQSPVDKKTKTEAFKNLFGGMYTPDKPKKRGRSRSKSRSGRSSKKLRYTFDEEDQAKLERLESERKSPKEDPEPVVAGVVENRRKLRRKPASPIRSKGYLASKVIKVDKEAKASTSTPKKKELFSKEKKELRKLKDANKKTRKILDRLETKVGVALKSATLTKVEETDASSDYKKTKVMRRVTNLIDSINLCILSGCGEMNTVVVPREDQYSTPGGKKIYTYTIHPYSSPTSSPQLLLFYIIPYPFLTRLIFQVPVHRHNKCLLQFFITPSSNLQLLKIILVQKSVRFFNLVKMPVLILFFVYDHHLFIVI